MKYYQNLLNLLESASADTLKLSLKDVHAKGMFSLVIGGSEFGKLTRVFIADKKLKPYDVQLHTHRYPIILTPLRGHITHHVAEEFASSLGTSVISKFDYLSPLNFGQGLTYEDHVGVKIRQYSLPIGCSEYLDTQIYHTLSCNKGSIWVVEEKGFQTQSSKVLGVPFITEGLYNEPDMFQINDKVQLVRRVLKEIINHYELV